MTPPTLVAWTPLDRTVLCLDCSATYMMAPTTLGTKACPACSSAKFIPIARWLDRDAQGGQ
jgi:hypothetical protein